MLVYWNPVKSWVFNCRPSIGQGGLVFSPGWIEGCPRKFEYRDSRRGLEIQNWLIIQTFGNGLIALITATSIISAPVNNQDVEVMKNKKVVKEIQSEVDIETYVNEYFADTPILAKIAFCESTYRHFDENGEVLRGVVDNSDIGVMQINKRYHGETADKLGLDIFSLNGNLRYAKILYDDQGVQPWSASKPCWSKSNPHLAQS